MRFTVKNPDGTEPDFEAIAKEPWVNADMPEYVRFRLTQNGLLEMILAWRGEPEEEAYSCPPGRFTIEFTP